MKKELSLQKSLLIFNGARGTYIPQHFAEEMLNPSCPYEFNTDSPSEQNSNRSYYLIREMLNELVQGQDNEFYWDNWNDLLCYYNEMRKISTNELFYLTQTEDGDLYLIHEDELEEWNEYDSEEVIDADAFTLVVDLDERGEYRCHVENCDDDVVWECETEDAISLVEDGFLPCVPHECVDDLLKYLQSHNILGENAKLKNGSY